MSACLITLNMAKVIAKKNSNEEFFFENHEQYSGHSVTKNYLVLKRILENNCETTTETSNGHKR